MHSVFNNDAVNGLFTSYLNNCQEEYEIQSLDSFGVSTNAVKSVQKSFKQVLKLDKNFHLYIHGNRELVENGFDEQKGMNYYKLYYHSEQ